MLFQRLSTDLYRHFRQQYPVFWFAFRLRYHNVIKFRLIKVHRESGLFFFLHKFAFQIELLVEIELQMLSMVFGVLVIFKNISPF